MKRLTIKGFWQGVYGCAMAWFFVALAGVIGSTSDKPVLTGADVFWTTILFCLLILFGWLFINSFRGESAPGTRNK